MVTINSFLREREFFYFLLYGGQKQINGFDRHIVTIVTPRPP